MTVRIDHHRQSIARARGGTDAASYQYGSRITAATLVPKGDQPPLVAWAGWQVKAANARAAFMLSRAAVFRRGLSVSRSALGEAFGLLRSALGARPTSQQGLLISKQFYDQLGGHNETVADPEGEFYRRIGRRRTVLLRCGISRVAGKAIA